MQEVNFKEYHSFLETIKFSETKSDLDIMILGVNDISIDTALSQLDLFRNEFYEITLVTNQSQFKFAIDGKLYHPKGEPYVCFVAPNQLQSYKSLGHDQEIEGYIIYFSKVIYHTLIKLGAVNSFFKREFESYYQLTTQEYQDLVTWLHLAYQEFKGQQLTAKTVISNLLAIFLTKAKATLTETKSALASRPHEITDHFLALIDQHYANKNVRFYADEMALTPKQLNTITKQTLGKTALKVIQEAIVEKAKAFILQSNHTLSEVAYLLGFDELSNFSRLFKRITGHSPNAFRAQSLK